MDRELDARVADLAQTQHGLVTGAQVRALGATRSQVRHRLATGRWLALGSDVYALAGAPATWRRALLGATFAAGPVAVAARRVAAALVPLPGFPEGPLEVVGPRGRARLVRGVQVTESLHLPDHHVRVVDGIPVTTVARTLFDLTGAVHPARSERALDNALSRRLVTIPACWRVLDDLAEHGRAGTVCFRAFLEARGDRLRRSGQ